jgi:aerobic carbon-monoxide dehydrogenase large subunit
MSTVEERTSGNGYVGQAMRRREDPRFITGRGIYVDDIARPGTLHMAVVRSP